MTDWRALACVALLHGAGALQAQGTDAAMARALNRTLDDAVRETHFMGTVLVADRRGVRYLRTAGTANAEWGQPNGRTTRFRIASVTKQFTALLVMQQVESGRLRLDGTVTEYLPWFPAEFGGRITIEHLLTHMSGIRDIEEVPGYYATDDTTLRTHADVVKRHLIAAPAWPPGSNFRYNNADFIVLGAVLEAVTGLTFETLLQRRILDPLGLRNTGVVHEQDVIPMLAYGYEADSSGTLRRAPAPVERFLASGAMYSTPGDLATWHRALLRHTLLSAAATERMFRPNQWGGALGSWQYDWTHAADSARPVAQRAQARVIERQGWIGVFRAFTAIIPDRGVSVIVIANGGSADLSTLSRGSGLVSSLLAAVERGTRPGR